MQNQKVLITGANGLIGYQISKALLKQGFELVVLGRKELSSFKEGFDLPCSYHQWKNPSNDLPPREALDVDHVIHLMGEPLAGARWTDERLQSFRDSRILSTQNLISALSQRSSKPKTFISASAIGYYNSSFTEEFTEDSTKGSGFLSDLCSDWEKESQKAPCRNIQLRISLVLSGLGGALKQMTPVFENGVGGKLASGQQWMSWIHIDDLTNAVLECLKNTSYFGPINLCSPHPVTNSEFTNELAKAVKTRVFLPVPEIALKLALGKMSALVLDSQKVLPTKLQKLSFPFQYEKIEQALAEIFSWKTNKIDRLFYAEQWVPKNKNEMFDFFCDEKNLERLTPNFLNFKVLNKSTSKIEKNTEINYSLKIHGIPVKWKTLIAEWKPTDMFQDIQLKGPYKKWEHTHGFFELSNGTLLTDKVIYNMPLTKIGGNIAQALVRKDIQTIFDYRKKEISKLF